MAVPKETIWPIESHSIAKHEILRRYLEAWFPILNSFNGQIVYIDGFCGPGRYLKGEEGSPIIALKVALDHRSKLSGELKFIFIDEHKDRINHLLQEIKDLNPPGHFNIKTLCSTFQDQYYPIIEDIEKGAVRTPPIFAFVDPFGFSGIPYSIIANLLKKARSDVLITFMIDSINRWLSHPEEKIPENIIETFGTKEVLSILKLSSGRIEKLRALYQNQLHKVAKYVRYFQMCDKNDRPIYYLFFATNHELGHLKMKEAMWKTDVSGLYSFSDATNPAQIVLLEEDATYKLKDELIRKFSSLGQLTGKQVKSFVQNETAFLKKHMTQVLIELESDNAISVAKNKIDGKKRRAKSYPDEVLITFT